MDFATTREYSAPWAPAAVKPHRLHLAWPREVTLSGTEDAAPHRLQGTAVAADRACERLR